MEEKIIIFTDGASKGNPGPGGWGAIVSAGEKICELGGREEHTTNNRMELRGALEALDYAFRMGGKHIILHTDSSYVINGVTKWSYGWKARGWVTQKKEEVLNQDLWKDLLEIADMFKKVDWKYVGGHVGIAGNERVDRIASDLAEGKDIRLYDGPFSGYGIDISNIELDGAQKKIKSSKSASKSRSKLPAYSYVSEVNGEIKTHATWAECEARVKGKRARFKKAVSREEEAVIIATFS